MIDLGRPLAGLVARLPLPAGRGQRRYWAKQGRAHIEVKGVHRHEQAALARHVVRELSALPAVRWAEVNAAVGRVVVAYDETGVTVADIVSVVELAEEEHGVDTEQFPFDRAEHPGDVEPVQRQAFAVAADVAGLGLAVVGRLVRATPLTAELASLVSLVDATPALRRPLESRLGHAVTDLGLATANAVGQGLAQGPLGLLLDIGYRSLVLDELRARRTAWEMREPDLHPGRAHAPAAALQPLTRPVPLPAGPVEAYADRAAVAAVAAAAAVGAGTRDPRLMVTATVAAIPKAARLGREGFATRVARDLARRGIVPMDAQVLRRFDRVDMVIIDPELLTTGRFVIGPVWATPALSIEEEDVGLTIRALLNEDHPLTRSSEGPWTLSPVTGRLAEQARVAAGELRAPGRHLLALRRDGALTALAGVDPELDPLAGALAAAAGTVGTVAIAGHANGLAARLHTDEVAGGTRLVRSVRAAQAAGRVVAVVSSRWPTALAAADVGVGVPRAATVPWGAHLITGPELGDACRVLQAVGMSRAVSRRAAMFAAYGSGAAGLLALTGPRRGATTRALVAVNGAATASLVAGVWTAATLDRRRMPLPVDSTDWHALSAQTALERLQVGPAGLDEAEARRRRRPSDGEDEPTESGLVAATLGELANPLTPALAAGAGLAAASGSLSDATLIGSVMLANAVLGGVQRVRVDRALRRLTEASSARIRLRRAGRETTTTADQLVAGDVISLTAGDAVPADCRILTELGLETDESSLTGESQPVAKATAPTVATVLAERRSMLYAGTTVAAGSATCLVVATGPETELARSVRAGEPDHRPGGVHARLRQLTRITVPVSVAAGAALVGAGILHGRPLANSLGTGVSLAVAAVPEGLPVVATVAQLGAARRLSHRNALVRNPNALEALGRVDVLCFDKTGTLTEGRINLHLVVANGAAQPLDALDGRGRLVVAAGLRASQQAVTGEQLVHSTDRALVRAAGDAGVDISSGSDTWKPLAELPFEATRGYHAVLGQTPAGRRLAVKGAPETVLPRCSHVLGPDGPVSLAFGRRGTFERSVDELARRGYRVIAVAERPASGRRDLDADRIERLQLLGLLAFTDPIRGSAADAVAGLRTAGVDVVMLTGDHPSTAQSIAAELHLLGSRRVVTGPELDRLSDPEVASLVHDGTVFARVSPSDKVRIVAALQRSGRVVAVTGDGANDAPAIRLADVGVAMGRGANAAKEAADVVVTDDKIETVIDAIVEGRAMWSSVRDAIAVLVGGNLGEIAFTLGTGLLLPGGSPITARQLLLVNLLTDVLPAMALAARPPDVSPKRLLHEGPEASLGTALTRDVIVRGVITASAGVGAWTGGRMTGLTSRHAGTVALVGIVGAQLGQTLTLGRRDPLVAASVLVSAAALAGVIQTPGVSQFFGCQPLGPVGWSIGLGSAATASLSAPALMQLSYRFASA